MFPDRRDRFRCWSPMYFGLQGQGPAKPYERCHHHHLRFHTSQLTPLIRADVHRFGCGMASLFLVGYREDL